ncbi:hypothetical protein BDR06DRAFT_325748 [Suillus hirtellus]|nr:hypothetical protein BDR06DRAFT_325748 [Suillus hirtellus]
MDGFHSAPISSVVLTATHKYNECRWGIQGFDIPLCSPFSCGAERHLPDFGSMQTHKQHPNLHAGIRYELEHSLTRAPYRAVTNLNVPRERFPRSPDRKVIVSPVKCKVADKNYVEDSNVFVGAPVFLWTIDSVSRWLQQEVIERQASRAVSYSLVVKIVTYQNNLSKLRLPRLETNGTHEFKCVLTCTLLSPT